MKHSLPIGILHCELQKSRAKEDTRVVHLQKYDRYPLQRLNFFLIVLQNYHTNMRRETKVFSKNTKSNKKKLGRKWKAAAHPSMAKKWIYKIFPISYILGRDNGSHSSSRICWMHRFKNGSLKGPLFPAMLSPFHHSVFKAA